jgi:dTDP-4-dehydrorhamnose reductase
MSTVLTNDMRVLILGGSGMLGHKLWQHLAPRHETFVTFRTIPSGFPALAPLDAARVRTGVTADDFATVSQAIGDVRPDVVVNCIGIIKQDAAAKDPIASVKVNALFPHLVAARCRDVGSRLVHLSTDCVFSGNKGNYSERDNPDPVDLYGRSKLLGEVDGSGHLTIRTSIIGRELNSAHGLLEWFLSRAGTRIRGYRRAIFSGFTTNALAQVIERVIVEHGALSGVWHVAAQPISKYDLLSLANEIFDTNVAIEPDDAFTCDRSLDGSRFVTATGLVASDWRSMLEELHADPTEYPSHPRTHAG